VIAAPEVQMLQALGVVQVFPDVPVPEANVRAAEFQQFIENNP
jgi:hypothetical protein